LSLVLREKKFLETDLGRDGIKVEWVQSLGSNKALELLASKSIDFGSTAGVAALIGRANGNPIKAIYVYSKPEWTALAVARDSSIRTVADLRGRKVAVTRGTDPHVFLLRALDSAGMSEKDIRLSYLEVARMSALETPQAGLVVRTRRRAWTLPDPALGWLVPGSALVAWEVLARAGVLPANGMPAPSAIAATTFNLARTGELWQHILITLWRIALGFAAGASAGIVLGALTGTLPLLRKLLDPILQALRNIPSMAWVPLFLLWLGIQEASKIAGLEHDFQGDVTLGGAPITGPGLDRGFVFQEPRLFPWLTVEGNVGFGLAGRSDRSEEIATHIDLVGLKGFERSFPHQFSGGMAQRAAIARALVGSPLVLLLDEPFGALDALTRIRMQQEILRIWEAERTTMILVTHDIDEAVFLADRVVILAGRPAGIHRIVPVDLPRPRDRASQDFTRVRECVYREFFPREEPRTAAYTI
jgi:sulfonate transport system ATP-binding protein